MPILDLVGVQDIGHVECGEHIMLSRELLQEAATDNIYHYMPTSGAVRTLTDGYYSLENSTAIPSEEMWAPKGKPWYLATTRSLVGDYTLRHSSREAVVFDIDGRWINARYETHPIDYWEGTNRPGGHNIGPEARTSESEDRVFSKKHFIPLRGSTKSIHIFISPIEQLPDYVDVEAHQYRLQAVKNILVLAMHRGIPAYLYDNRQGWLTQREKYRIDPLSARGKELLGPAMNRPPSTYRRTMSDYYANIRFWVELLTKNPGDELTDQAEKLVSYLRYYGDTSTSLKTDIHNASRNPEDPDYQFIIAVNDYMIRNRIKKIDDLVDHIKQKWRSYEIS